MAPACRNVLIRLTLDNRRSEVIDTLASGGDSAHASVGG